MSRVHRCICLTFALLLVLVAGLAGLLLFYLAAPLPTDQPELLQLQRNMLGNILWLTGGLFVALLMALFYLICAIANPLAAMAESTRALARGDLGQHLPGGPAGSDNPIGKIGANVHELAINLQEILLLIWNMSEEDIGVLDDLRQKAAKGGHQEELARGLDFLKGHRQETQQLVAQFNLFNVALQDKRLVAKDEGA
ncbi:MAG: hypothetical protein ABFR97_00065 [Thermodesulfobacteriota bacterium]